MIPLCASAGLAGWYCIVARGATGESLVRFDNDEASVV